MSHGTDGKVYDRVSFTWVTPEEMARRDAHREELAFQRRSRQGELCAPMVIADGLGTHGVQSMLDGRQYDSKSRLRATYRDAGVREMGNDHQRAETYVAPHKRQKGRAEREAVERSRRETWRRAVSRVNLTSYRKEELPTR